MFAKINADFAKLVANYCFHNALYPPLAVELARLKKDNPAATQCCMQLSHAFNAAGGTLTIPHEGKPGRRSWGNDKIPGGNGYYLLAVDEVEDFLTAVAGKTDEFPGGPPGKLKPKFLGRKGVLLFRDGPPKLGYHTELWTGTEILQNHGISGNMSEKGIFGQQRILFWQVGPDPDPLPSWLQGWWEVFDTNYYYYWFSDAPGVCYTETKPVNVNAPPEDSDNWGSVDMKAVGPVITWVPIGKKPATIETFTRLGAANPPQMEGTSNNYGKLTAKKMS